MTYPQHTHQFHAAVAAGHQPQQLQLTDCMVDALRAFFDLLDTRRVGAVPCEQLLKKWWESPTASAVFFLPNTSSSKNSRAKALAGECLRGVAFPSGMLTFERFVAGVRLAVARHHHALAASAAAVMQKSSVVGCIGKKSQANMQWNNLHRVRSEGKLPNATDYTDCGDHSRTNAKRVNLVHAMAAPSCGSAISSANSASSSFSTGGIGHHPAMGRPAAYRNPDHYQQCYRRRCETYRSQPNLAEFGAAPDASFVEHCRRKIWQHYNGGIVDHGNSAGNQCFYAVPDTTAVPRPQSAAGRGDSGGIDGPTSNYSIVMRPKKGKTTPAPRPPTSILSNRSTVVGGGGTTSSNAAKNTRPLSVNSALSGYSSGLSSTADAASGVAATTPNGGCLAASSTASSSSRKSNATEASAAITAVVTPYANELLPQVERHQRLLAEERTVVDMGMAITRELLDWFGGRVESLEKRRRMLDNGMVALDSAVHEQKLDFYRAQIAELTRRMKALIGSAEHGFPTHANMLAGQPNATSSSPSPIVRRPVSLVAAPVGSRRGTVISGSLTSNDASSSASSTASHHSDSAAVTPSRNGHFSEQKLLNAMHRKQQQILEDLGTKSRQIDEELRHSSSPPMPPCYRSLNSTAATSHNKIGVFGAANNNNNNIESGRRQKQPLLIRTQVPTAVIPQHHRHQHAAVIVDGPPHYAADRRKALHDTLL